ncbi:hypothetical protein GOODEAATRI_019521 [Goodea atripinnis]|uniref:Calmodulin-binding transcription activator 2 n=1 Tax=Goodea atripinnis TaxID=208336 RepID=A0ABV0N3L3_9TELE
MTRSESLNQTLWTHTVGQLWVSFWPAGLHLLTTSVAPGGVLDGPGCNPSVQVQQRSEGDAVTAAPRLEADLPELQGAEPLSHLFSPPADNQFRMSILERLEQMERRMAEMAARDRNHHPHQQQQNGNQLATPPPPLPEDHDQPGAVGRSDEDPASRASAGQRRHPEARVQAAAVGEPDGWEAAGWRCRVMTGGVSRSQRASLSTLSFRLNLARPTLNRDSLDLEQEVDPLNVDHFSCTPLMWACALGHQRAAELLYSWNSLALGIPDSLGRLPLAVARSRGHTRLAAALEELHTQRTQMTTRDVRVPPADTPQSPLSTSPDTGLSSSSSLPSPSDPSSPSPSSAYSSGPAPMDTSPSSPSSLSSSSLPVSPPSPSSFPVSTPPSVSMWREEPNPTFSAGKPGELLIQTTLQEHPDPKQKAMNQSPLPTYQVDMATLAEQIIEATPERIKQEDFPRGAESPLRERRDNPALQDTWLATYLETVDTHTHSPPSALALQRLRPPSSAAWAEFLNASANGKMERDFALLTLTDGEQRELYEAARIIQNAFRRYKYALYKKMTQAAILIQSKFRSYYEQKRFQQSRRAAVLIQQYYRSYKEYERLKQAPRGGATHNPKIKIKELKQTRELERRGLTT